MKKEEIKKQIKQELEYYFDNILNGDSDFLVYDGQGKYYSTGDKAEWYEEWNEIIKEDIDDGVNRYDAIFNAFSEQLDELEKEGYDKELIHSFGDWEGWSVCVDKDLIVKNEENYYYSN